ncbi:MAG TPA: AgmX/PglI C-terminal domain-containing protein [Geobacteraceae bacterium]
MNTSLLQQELAPLNAKIELARERLTELKREISAVEAELETFSADRMRFDALREACDHLDRLDQLEAGQLFWGESPEIKDSAGHMERLRTRIARFDEMIRGILERQAQVKAQADQRLDELDYLYYQIDEAHDRDERRDSEFAIMREISAVSHEAVMPWSAETDQRFRRTQLIAMLLCLLLAIVIHQVVVPKAVRPAVAQIPERLAMMVREEPKRPEPAKKAMEEKEAKKQASEKKVAKSEEKKEPAPTQAAPARPKAEPVEQTAAPKRSQNTGVLAFKETFNDLLDETNNPKLGSEARLSNNANQSGHAVASRSLVTMNGSGGSGGIANGAFSRNVGSGGIGNAATGRGGGGNGNGARIGRGGNGFAQVKSGIAGAGGKGDGAKPLTAGGKPSRTDEEIQLLFDRYKAALYRIYNTELRKDPTLRGKMVLRITIEPSGAVSACGVDSCNMNAPDFNAQIVARVKKFNFGPKDGVPKTTILYPIDFLPAR